MASNNKVPNVAPNKILESQELITKDESTVRIADGVIEDDAPDIEIESNIYDAKERAAALAFNEEPVTIIISQDNNPQNNPEPYVYLSVNGRGAGPNGVPWVPRGVEITVKRMYVERLARARPSSYDSVERQNAQGEKEVVYPRTSALKYPFSVIEDKNPKGARWLSALLSER